MVKSQLTFLFFVDMQDSMEEVLVLLHKLSGELHFPWKKYVVPAAKRIGANLFGIAAPEIGEVVSGRDEKLKTLAKDVGNKNISKTVGGRGWKKQIEA